MYGEGISKEGCVLDMAVEAGIVQKSGSWFNYGEERLGQGREAVKGLLHENPDLRGEIENKVREFYELDPITTGAESEA
jgi:recombination protein RecA